ncbi:MAG: hypothetical protein JST30_09920 [Armatimonadetes bacterium]|nr:hypothetical protein [Armatimonadota bacterium]
MRRSLLPAVFGSFVVLAGLAAAGRLVQQGGATVKDGVEAIGSKALAFRYAQRLDGRNGVRADAMMRAVAQRKALIEAQGGQIAGGPVWTYLGPDNVGGRVRSVVPHPTVAGTLWIASVGGGIWKTTNSGSSWFPLNENLPSLCIGSLIIDKSNPSVLYAGSGESYFDSEFAENNKAAVQGAGIYKTTDGGTSWNQLASTVNPDFNCVSRLAMSPTDPLTILASTDTGLFRTTDGGQTWVKVYNGKVFDVDFHPTDPNRAVAGLPAAPGVVRSADGGQTWSASTGIASTIRCETAWSKSAPNNVYAAVCTGSSFKVWKSTDSGQTWVVKTTSSFGNYEAYNCMIWVDPTNDNNLIVGGVNAYRSTNQGVSGSQAFTNVHLDFHWLAEEPGFDGTTKRRVWFGTDGGVATAANVYANTTTDLNNSLGITQFYGGAMNDSTGRIVAGAQDNYTQVGSGSLNWVAEIGGDGVHCANDPSFPNTFYAGYYYMNMFRSTDGGNNFGTDVTAGISDRGNEVNCNFIPYLTLDPNQSNTMLACCRRLWRSTNIRTGNPPTWTAIKPPIAAGPGGGGGEGGPPPDHFASEMPYNLSFCAIAKGDSNVIWAGHNNGQLYKTTNGTAGSPSWTRVDLNGPLPARWISSIVIDPGDKDHVYVAFMGWTDDNLWETNDGGATFHQVTGIGQRHIPEAPVSAFALDPLRPGHLFAGTDIGIFVSWDNGQSWSVETQGPGTVPIDFFQWRNNSTLVTYTYGRGAWSGAVGPADTSVGPTGFQTVRGRTVAGGLSSLQASDDADLTVAMGPIVPGQDEAPVTVDMTTVAPGSVANGITVTLESSGSAVGLTQELYAYDFDAQAWVLLDARTATLADQVVSVPVGASASRFIAPTTREMKVRYRLKAAGPAPTGKWHAALDRVRWTVSQ